MAMDSDPSAGARERAAAAVRARLAPLQDHAVGRVTMGTLADLNRVEIFDRSMTIAAQVFTSIFPILIMLGVFASQRLSLDIAADLALPTSTAAMLGDVFADTSTGSFGLVGGALVIISATSLSRALARMYTTVWHLPRPPRGLTSWWRWLAVVLTFALSLLVIRRLVRASEGFTAPAVWGFVIVALGYTVVLLGISYVLVQGQVPARQLLPGAVLGAAAIGAVSVASGLWLPHALSTGEERFGPIGVAFTYLGYLYVLAFALVLTTVLGAVLVRDGGATGRRLRREGSTAGASAGSQPRGHRP